MSKQQVPESLRKKQERDAKYAADEKAAKDQATKDRNEKKTIYADRAQKYFEEYQKHDQDIVDSKRKAKKEGSIFVEPEAKVALVVRSKGIMKMRPTSKKILQLIRLRQINNAVFLVVNKATLNMLKRCSPCVTFGYPNRKTIRELVYKRGFAKVNGARIPLSDNSIVEKELGKHGIICVEDLIHEIATCGPHFRECNRFLWPFKLNSRRGGTEKKNKPYQQGGCWGNREDKINEFVRNMI
jgi:large subunit ribosomal protein L7e